VRERYFIDTPTPDEAHSPVGGEPAFYVTVIRDRGRDGWTFRFSSFDVRLARETLAALNVPKLVAHHWSGARA
jgi:hypothetical protein